MKLPRHSEARSPIPKMLIPVYLNARIVDMIDPIAARRFATAPNATVIRKRKTGAIVQINLVAMVIGDDRPGAREDSRVFTYQEPLKPAPIPMLKLVGETGVFRRWNSRDAFNPRRFNPDTLPRTAREMARS